MRTVSMPTIGAFTSGEKNANAATTTSAAPHGIAVESRKSGSGIATIANAASFMRFALPRELLRGERADQRADAEGAEEEAEHVRVRVVADVREPLDADDQPLRDEVDHAGRDHDRPEERVAHEELDAGEDAARRGRWLDALAGAHDERDRQEREDVRERVDHEDGRRARRRDQDAGEHRAGELGQLVRAAEDRVDLA